MQIDDYYFYPHSSVLRNKKGFRFQQDLDRYETSKASKRMLAIEYDPFILGEPSFDFEYLKRIHGYLFQDVYDWAGEVKLQNTYKKNINYTDIEDIEVRSEDIFQDVISDFSPGMSKSEFCEKGGKLLYDIHFLHPFREGNSRTERTFMYLLGKRCDISLNYSCISRQTWQMIIFKANQSKSPDSFCEFLKKACSAED